MADEHGADPRAERALTSSAEAYRLVAEARQMRDERDRLTADLAAERRRSEMLREALAGLRETGPDEPLMDDPSYQGRLRSLYSFWFCGGTLRKGHADDCPWTAAMALAADDARRDGEEGT